MPRSAGITITIESAESGREHVSLNDFSFQLDALKKVLSNTESSLSGEQAEIDWQIVDLKHSSPAQVVLRPIIPFNTDRLEDIAFETTNKVISYLKTLSGSANQPLLSTEMSQHLLAHYGNFGDRIQKGILRVSLRSETDIVRVSKGLKAMIETLILPETKSVGTVEGRMEYVNIHDGRNRFRIYSKIPPEQVVCSFSSDKMEKS